jgi:hypothetical protein
MRRVKQFWSLAAVLLAAGAIEGAERRSAPEEQVRAAFLYQLAQFVHWPEARFAGSQTPLRFCVLGDEDLERTLQAIAAGKTIDGRTLVVGQVLRPEDLVRCHVAFVALRSERQLRDFFSAWRYPPVLIAGEWPGFADYGGMVNLRLEDGRVSFDVNLESIGRAQLELRSQLLRFARLVGPKGARR